MRTLPETEDALVIRTDFGDQRTWDAICAEVFAPIGVLGFVANVLFVDDQAYDGATRDQIAGAFPAGASPSFTIVADRTSMSHPEHPLLVLDLLDESGGAFRAVPSAIQAIENNLSIGNMDFEEFAGAADEDGIFRGFQD